MVQFNHVSLFVTHLVSFFNVEWIKKFGFLNDEIKYDNNLIWAGVTNFILTYGFRRARNATFSDGIKGRRFKFHMVTCLKKVNTTF